MTFQIHHPLRRTEQIQAWVLLYKNFIIRTTHTVKLQDIIVLLTCSECFQMSSETFVIIDTFKVGQRPQC